MAVKLVLVMMLVTIGGVGVSSVGGEVGRVPGPRVSPAVWVIISAVMPLVSLVTIHIMVPGVTVMIRVSVVLHSLQQRVTWPPVIPIAPIIMHWPATQSANNKRSYNTRAHSPPVSLIIIDGLWQPMSVLGLPVLPRVMVVTTELLPGPVVAELARVVTLAVLRALDRTPVL